jgi:Uma2 family endonuclease
MSDVSERLLTAQDLLRPGSPYRDCELWDGTAVVRGPSGGWADTVAAAIVGRLWQHVHSRRLGRVFSASQGFRLRRDPDRVLSPDGAYVAGATLPRLPERGFFEGPPDFVLEVRSPEDSWERVVEKCGVWIAEGVKVAWAVDPPTRRVVVMRGGEAPVVAEPGGAVDAAPALPGFRLAVEDAFSDF